MIRRYISWRNRHVTDPKLRKVIRQAETIKATKVGLARVRLTPCL